MKQQYLIRFLLINKILNILFATNINKKTEPLCIFFPEMSIYKSYSDKIKRMYFMRNI